MIKRSISYQLPSCGSLGMSWLLMHRHTIRLRHLPRFLETEHVWAPFLKQTFSQLASLTEFQSWVKTRPRLGAWHLECRQAPTVLYKSGNMIGGRSTLQRVISGEVRRLSRRDPRRQRRGTGKSIPEDFLDQGLL